MTAKPDAPATGRNRMAILEVLRDELSTATSLLEIGSGTGQHAVFFAREMPHLNWQPSDRATNIEGIAAWVNDANLKNLAEPIALDVLSQDRVEGTYDAVFSANTAHIMSYPAVECMFELVGRTLQDGGVFCLYGPFNTGGTYTSESNGRFDQSLRERDPDMGIRDLEDLDGLAVDNGLLRAQLYAMPSNNMLVVWKK